MPLRRAGTVSDAGFITAPAQRRITACRAASGARLTGLVRLAALVERFAADAVEAELGSPWQHQRAAAAVAVDPLQRQRPQHGLTATGTDGEGRDLVGALHCGILRGVSAQHLRLAWIGSGF